MPTNNILVIPGTNIFNIYNGKTLHFKIQFEAVNTTVIFRMSFVHKIPEQKALIVCGRPILL